MTWFLLGMLVMWFCYPLLKATQTTMVVKWNNLTMNTKEEIDENTTIGFRIGAQMNYLMCRNGDCDNVVWCDVDVIAVTCSDCCVNLGIDNNITFGGQMMESLVSAIVWFGNTVVICIVACVVYCMFSNERSK